MQIPFELPLISKSKKPIWNGSYFLIEGGGGDTKFSVLEYSENFQGWSDDLSLLHEDSGGEMHPIDLSSRNDALNQMKSLKINSNSVIMEIGCSSGFLIKEIVNIYPENLIIGVDVVKAPLYNLAKKLPNVPLFRFDINQNPLPDSIVDVLIMLNVLEHIENDVLALQNVFKLLKPGGTLIIEVPAGKFLYDGYDKQLLHFRRYTLNELSHKVKLSGFIIKRKSYLGFFIFPIFIIIKLFNKYLNKKNTVFKNNKNTANSLLLSLIMKLEVILSRFTTYPFGVRVLMTAKKPN
jgi:SAM-dependent methyltransferase